MLTPKISNNYIINSIIAEWKSHTFTSTRLIDKWKKNVAYNRMLTALTEILIECKDNDTVPTDTIELAILRAYDDSPC